MISYLVGLMCGLLWVKWDSSNLVLLLLHEAVMNIETIMKKFCLNIFFVEQYLIVGFGSDISHGVDETKNRFFYDVARKFSFAVC